MFLIVRFVLWLARFTGRADIRRAHDAARAARENWRRDRD
jgi:hypothetical protein